MATLREDHPTFWDDTNDEFTGPVSTNAIEGGNWRLKDGLGVPYARVPCGTATAVRDSVSVFENGRPTESFALRHGSFSFEQVMGSHSATVSWEEPQQATSPLTS